MTNTNNLETLQSDVNQVAAELVEVKKLEDEALKKSKAEAAALKAETLLSQVVVAKEEASKKLETLKGKTDATSMAEISRLETEIASLEVMLQTLNSSKADLAVLKEWVASYIVNEEVKAEIAEEEKEPEIPDEKKGWLKRQVDGLSDSTEENHALKNTGRILWGIWILAVGIRWIKKLFNRGKKKVEKKEGESSTTEKKWFWKNLLIWLGVGTWAYYLVHGLVTGRWWISDALNWDKKNKEDVGDLSERYKNEVPEALKPKYEQFGTVVDGYHNGIESGDSLWVLENSEGKEVAIPKGCIPAALDNAYDNVWDMLDPSNTINEQWADTWWQLRDWVKWVGKDVAGVLLKPFTWLIKWLKSTMYGSDGKPNEEFDLRAKGADLDRDTQIGNLMQKYAMVTTYLSTKKEWLEREYAKQYLISTNNSNPTEKQINEACTNDDKAIEYIEAKMEAEFYNRRIVSASDEGSILPILQKYNIYNTEPSETDKKIAEEVDSRKKEIVTDPLFFEKCKASPDINKDSALKAELLATSERFAEYLDKWIIQRNMLESMANCFWLNLDEIRNGKAADIENMIEELWFNNEVAAFKQQTIDFKIKLVDGTVTKKDIEDFEKTINTYFDKEKQVLIKAKNKNNAEWGFWNNVWYRSKERVYKLTHTAWWIAILVWWVAFWTLYVKSPWFRKIVAIPANFVKHSIWSNTRMPKIWGINYHWKLASYPKDGDYLDVLLKDFQNWKIDRDIAQDIFTRRVSNGDWKCSNSFIDEISSRLPLNQNQTRVLFRYTEHRNIRKLLKNGKYVELVTELENFEKQVALLSGNKKILLENMIVKWNIKSIDDIRNISKNIKNMDDALLSKLNPRGIKKLTKELAKDMSIFNDIAKLNAKLSWTTTISASADLLKAQDEIIDAIVKESDALKTTLKNSNIFIDQPISIVDNYYKIQVDGLETFKLQVKSFTKVEVDGFKQLKSMKFKATHIAELFALGKTNPAIKAALNTTDDLDTLLAVLKAQKAANPKIKISDDLIKILDDIQLAKVAGKYTDDVLQAAAVLFKFVANIT